MRILIYDYNFVPGDETDRLDQWEPSVWLIWTNESPVFDWSGPMRGKMLDCPDDDSWPRSCSLPPTPPTALPPGQSWAFSLVDIRQHTRLWLVAIGCLELCLYGNIMIQSEPSISIYPDQWEYSTPLISFLCLLHSFWASWFLAEIKHPHILISHHKDLSTSWLSCGAWYVGKQ